MRALALPVIGLALLLSACSQEESPASTPEPGALPRFCVVSGERLFEVDVDDSLQRTQDDVVLAARKLWRGLAPGESVEFHLEGRSAGSVGTDPSHEGGEGSAPGATVISEQVTITSTSETYRMFKDRDGVSGIEEAPEKPYGLQLRSGPAIGWTEIEEDIRGKVFPALCFDFPDRNRWGHRTSED